MGLHGTFGALILGFTLSKVRGDEIVDKAVEKLRGFAHGIFILLFFAGSGLYVTHESMQIELLSLFLIIVTFIAER